MLACNSHATQLVLYFDMPTVRLYRHSQHDPYVAVILSWYKEQLSKVRS